MDEERYACQEECKYQQNGYCRLQRADLVHQIHGASCCEHLLDDETIIHL